MNQRPNRVPRETAKSFTKRQIPRDEQMEITRKENQRIREKMLKEKNKDN
jgi:hypothetical protein